jgi:hypothetical protein
MIKIINEGHKERAYCQPCGKIVPVTYKYKPYMTESGEAIEGVLQGFCDVCNKRLVIPPQSIPKIKPYYLRQDKTQEYKVPTIIEDALLNIGSFVHLEKPDVFKTILRFYLSTRQSESWIKKAQIQDLGPAKSRLSFRIDQKTDAVLTKYAHRLALNKNQFVAMMIWDAKDRLLNNQGVSKEYMKETKLFRAPEYIFDSDLTS